MKILNIFFILLAATQSLNANPFCFSKLSISRSDSTSKFIIYLTQLYEQKVLGEPELRRMESAIQSGQLVSPFEEHQTSTESKVLIHSQEIQRHLKAGIDRTALLKWIEEFLTEKQRVEIVRTTTKITTVNTDQKIEFLPIPAGKFKMSDKRVEIELTHDIEMMTTPVTQKQWVELMGENPSFFSKGPNSVTVTIKGHNIEMQPDHPVENVNWWSVLAFANKLSEKAGLKPAYDLSKLDLYSWTTAAAGNLTPSPGTAGHISVPAKLIYEAEGYRLPTDAEFEYVVRLAGEVQVWYAFEGGEDNLPLYAWYRDNAGESTHPVGQLRSHIIKGHQFFDLLGNVWEWNHSGFNNIEPATNPGGRPWGSTRVIRGGSWKSNTPNMRAHFRESESTNQRNHSIGFRLVRTLK